MYIQLAEIPTPTAAEFNTDHDDHMSTIVRLSLSMKSHSRNPKRSLSKLIFIHDEHGLLEDQPISRATSEDSSDIVLASPSKNKRATLRKLGSDKADEFSRYVEIWNNGVLEASVNVSDLHGDFYSDEYLGSLAFAPSELALIYVAELTNGNKKEHDPYRKYRYNPAFGEGFVTGACDPALFYLSWSPSTPPTVFRLRPVGFENVRFGQPIFDPQSSCVLYTTGYELTTDGKLLGIKGCFNRPSGIWRLQIPEPSSLTNRKGEKDVLKLAELDTEAIQKLTPPHLSCRSPRALRFDGRSVLLWLACASGGAHVSTSTLHTLDISSLAELDDQSLIASDKPLVNLIKEPLNDLSSFPGLYPSYNLPLSPFIFTEGDNQPCVLLHSQWGSRTTVLRISLKDGVVHDLTPDAEGKLYSWVVLATDGNKRFICSRSAPNLPYEILLGRFKENNNLNWLLLDKPILRDEVQQALGRVRTNVISIPGSSMVETIVIRSERSWSAKGLPPCVTSPHGGPHAASNTAFVPSTTALALEGFTVSLPNYTGSLGYGEAFLQGFIGRCGELDVQDCITVARHLVRLGISEEGIGKQMIMGGSHGGFLAVHLIGQFPKFFSSAVLRNPVISVGEISSTDIPDWYFSEFGLEYPVFSSCRSFESNSRVHETLPPLITASDFEKLRAASPILYIDEISVPVLLLIGKADRRVAPSHGIELYHALKARCAAKGKDVTKYVEMLTFNGEGHPLDGVETAKISFEAMVDWFIEIKQ